MLVNSLNLFSASKINNLNNNKQYSNFNLNKLEKDPVSFSGTKKKNVQKKKTISKEEQAGIDMGKRLSRAMRKEHLSLTNTGIILNEKTPVPIQVDYMQNSPVKLPPATSAHMFPLYNPDFTLNSAQIFINPTFQTTQDKGNFVANTAHEYTHVLQRAKDKSYFGLKKYTDDIEIIRYVIQTAQNTYNKISFTIGQNIGNNPEYITSKSTGKELNYESVKEIGLNNVSIDDEISTSILLSAMRNPELHNKTLETIPEKDFMNAIRNCIMKLAEFEKEAYNVTLDTLETWQDYAPETRVIRKAALDTNKMIIEQLKN